MRRAAKIDSNHADVVKVLLAYGCSVQSLAAIGHGCPDLLAGFRGRNWLFEVKPMVGVREPRPKALNQDQVLWHAKWAGSVHTVTSGEEALRIMGVKP
jgi:hypothetical protein